MNPEPTAVRTALVGALARLADVPAPTTLPVCDLLRLPQVMVPANPWQDEEMLCAAAQLACYEAACESLLPAIAQWGRVAGAGPVATFAGQSVRNALTNLRDLPLVSAGRDRADLVVWHLLTVHQFKFAVAADVRLGPLALVGYLAALQTVAAALGHAAIPERPQAGQPYGYALGRGQQPRPATSGESPGKNANVRPSKQASTTITADGHGASRFCVGELAENALTGTWRLAAAARIAGESAEPTAST